MSVVVSYASGTAAGAGNDRQYVVVTITGDRERVRSRAGDI